MRTWQFKEDRGAGLRLHSGQVAYLLLLAGEHPDYELRKKNLKKVKLVLATRSFERTMMFMAARSCVPRAERKIMELREYPSGTRIHIGDRKFEKVEPSTFWREIHDISGNCVSRPSSSLKWIEEKEGMKHVVIQQRKTLC